MQERHARRDPAGETLLPVFVSSGLADSKLSNFGSMRATGNSATWLGSDFAIAERLFSDPNGVASLGPVTFFAAVSALARVAINPFDVVMFADHERQRVHCVSFRFRSIVVPMESFSGPR